jgi:hypothetical protein
MYFRGSERFALEDALDLNMTCFQLKNHRY